MFGIGIKPDKNDYVSQLIEKLKNKGMKIATKYSDCVDYVKSIDICFTDRPPKITKIADFLTKRGFMNIGELKSPDNRVVRVYYKQGKRNHYRCVIYHDGSIVNHMTFEVEPLVKEEEEEEEDIEEEEEEEEEE